jgi:antirestriction protein ArdC
VSPTQRRNVTARPLARPIPSTSALLSRPHPPPIETPLTIAWGRTGRDGSTATKHKDAGSPLVGATIGEGFGEAYYRPGDDFISLPRFEAFTSAAHFYCTAFHELGHWTGHKSRLDRDLRHRFGARAYAAEELVAELCAAFLCAEFSIDGDLRHAGYIQSWIGLLRADSRAFFTASSRAQAAADYLRRLALAEPAARAAW